MWGGYFKHKTEMTKVKDLRKSSEKATLHEQKRTEKITGGSEQSG